ncbi:MAG: protein translocase subunit SecD [Candidatus Levybacteria bacterium]|nr:protein translocase subunit SecD [Candidatus Levybacteria bacterium]
MKNLRILFLLIIALTIISILINLPPSIPVSFQTPKLPIINKKISIQKTFKGIGPSLNLGPIRIEKTFSFRKGLDLEGGISITLKADMKDIPQAQRSAALDSAKTVIERRVNFFGVSEPLVQTATVKNDYRIVIELPGITDLNEAVNLVGKTAKLEFREVQEKELTTIPAVESTKPTGLSGADLQEAQVSFDSNTGQPVVLFRVADKSQQKFYETTQRLIGKRMAIFLDNQFISAPTVQAAIRDDGQITGNFTTEDAKRFALQLNAGALPVPLSVLEQRTIGPTLGASSLQKSLFAGVLGFIIIVIFMVVLYGRLGMIASIALFLYTLFVMAIFKAIPVTLTLAGIAGFILSIGMAVDANILIFERMREELRRGRAWEMAIEIGFTRAWTSIRDSNVSSLITSGILYYFGSGGVRGFALTLAIGVLVSMFSAIVVTRTFLRMFYGTKNI